jgi:putative oxidoreductase
MHDGAARTKEIRTMHLVTKWLPTVARILLGLVFTIFGLNGFLHFIPLPPMAGPPGELLGAFVASGYMMPMVKVVEVLGGIALLSGRFVPLALTLLAPIVINIAAFHFFLTPGEVGMAVFVLVLEIYLAWAYRDAFRGMLSATAKPSVSGAAASGRASKSLAAVAE